VALLLGLFIVHLGFTTLARLRRAQTRLEVRTDALVATRITRHVVRRELRHGRHGDDWFVNDDSIFLRAFRGTALVCPYDTLTLELTVVFGGDRRPDPSKDSVLLIGPLGSLEARALTGVGSSSNPCGPTALPPPETWRLDAAVPPGSVVARLYERGSYHLSASALRYRRGASGRQPLTPEVWSASSAWVRTGRVLGLEARYRDSEAGAPWSAFLAWLE